MNRASKVFSQNLLERRHIHHLLSQQLLQLGILNLKCLQSLGLRHFHAAIFGPPFNGMDVSPAIGNAAGVTQQNGERYDSRIYWN